MQTSKQITYFIHPTADVETHLIGAGTKIWRWVHISKGAVIGPSCIIGQGVYIGPNVKIGANCRIGNNAFIPEGVTIKSGCFIGPCVCFTNDRKPPRKKDSWEETIVFENTVIGANSTILPGLSISGFIGAGSVVTKSTRQDKVYVGNPAKERK